MRDKILFWLGVEFTHFCLSNAMQEKFDADYYALVDITAKTKKFFKQQNMVDFKNTWFFSYLTIIHQFFFSLSVK